VSASSARRLWESYRGLTIVRVPIPGHLERQTASSELRVIIHLLQTTLCLTCVRLALTPGTIIYHNTLRHTKRAIKRNRLSCLRARKSTHGRLPFREILLLNLPKKPLYQSQTMERNSLHTTRLQGLQCYLPFLTPPQRVLAVNRRPMSIVVARRCHNQIRLA